MRNAESKIYRWWQLMLLSLVLLILATQLQQIGFVSLMLVSVSIGTFIQSLRSLFKARITTKSLLMAVITSMAIGALVYVSALLTTMAVPSQTSQIENKYNTGPPEVSEILELVNDERQKTGAQSLLVDERLSASSAKKAQDMTDRRYFDHKDPSTGVLNGLNFIEETGISCNYISENIRWVELDGTSEDVFEGWKRSKLHIDAIRDKRYSYTGISVVKANDRFNIVQHFCIAK